MMSLVDRMTRIMVDISYKDWVFEFNKERSLFNIEFLDIDSDTGVMSNQKSRKWYISPHSTDSEIIQTIFLAVKVAEEHEMREKFTYNGVAIFGPHYCIEDIVAGAVALDKR